WDRVTDAHVLGTAQLGRHRVWRVSFFDPSTPAWFEASIERATGRTLELDMIAASHFMHDVYGPFDAPLRVTPPTENPALTAQPVLDPQVQALLDEQAAAGVQPPGAVSV